MIWFKIGNDLEEVNPSANIFELAGTIDVSPQRRYLFEKKDPFSINGYYRAGGYAIDKLNIKVICNPDIYETLYHRSLTDTAYLIAWNTHTGYQWRIVKQALPYPSKLRFVRDFVEFSVETEPYIHKEVMNDLTRNFKFGRSTPSNTVWN